MTRNKDMPNEPDSLCETDIPVIVVAGPTASGKSAAALAIAREFNGVVINADSMQLYKDLPLLTARPTAAEMGAVPHRLYGVLELGETCSAARWRDMAIVEIEAARQAGRLPVLCGGSGLYIKALLEGLSPIPEIPAAVRQAVRQAFEARGQAAMRAELLEKDPVMAARLEPADQQRTLRALEVLAATGRSLAQWQAAPKSGPPPGLRFATILITPPRDVLYAACNERLLQMVAQGVVEDVAAVFARITKAEEQGAGAGPSLRDALLLKALGVPQFQAYNEGAMDLAAAIEKAQIATRRYAKRQMTWIRGNYISQIDINEKYSQKCNTKIFSFIRQKRLTLDN
ncbi:MAG: tRNA (adenosine(37)-N6)-dimethylallyltransferase MiaA [Alphaproteobacteria bacterium]|jgi:tRNA dimethylallyltransferase